ncbi:MAG: 16S rRNA (cytosine(967)-C(5))-methyltransferase RsmB [Syntrophomonas sp.]
MTEKQEKYNRRGKSEVYESVRECAADLVYRVLEKGAYANLLLEKQIARSTFSGEDRRLLTEIVNGTVRMVKHLDEVLNLFLKGDVSSQNRWLRSVLRISAYQILFMDRVPEYAVVNDAVNIVANRAGKGLGRVANGVLRNLLRQRGDLTRPGEQDGCLAAYYSHPEWMVDQFIDQYGLDQTRTMLTFDNLPPAQTIRVNRLYCTPHQLAADLAAEGIDAQISANWPGALRVTAPKRPLSESRAFKSGRFYLQSEAAMLAGIILNPAPGETVYDLCCGVGGKSTHLAEIMDNKGRIVAFDIYGHKIKLLMDNCRRLGIEIVEAHEADVTGLSPQLAPGSSVLLDAPCSGLGVLARRSDSRWKKSLKDLQEMPGLQSLMLAQVARLVQKGGRLLYSTCTVNRGENEEVVKDFLKSHPHFQLQGFDRELELFPLDPPDRQACGSGMFTLLPGKYDTDGMFFALMKRED